jgi:hypothetical protein
VNSIRQQGKDVIIIGVGGAASSHSARSADEFIFYEQLIGKTVPVAAPVSSGRRVSDIDDFERPIERPVERILRILLVQLRIALFKNYEVNARNDEKIKDFNGELQ